MTIATRYGHRDVPMVDACQHADCHACSVESAGCGCDGALDDGCWVCTPSQWGRPRCGPAAEGLANGINIAESTFFASVGAAAGKGRGY